MSEPVTSSNLVFIDTETTSLRPDRRVWEIGLIVRRPGKPDWERAGFIHSLQLDLGNADPMSLKIGRYYDRHPHGIGITGHVESEYDALAAVEKHTRGAILVGAVPNFDAEVLGARMRANGICPSWHYHLVDVETLAAGAMKLQPPWDFDKVLDVYGLTYDEADRHTALGDARMVRDLYDAIMASDEGTLSDDR